MKDSSARIERVMVRAVGAVEDTVAKGVATVRRLSAHPVVAGRRRVVKAVDNDVVALTWLCTLEMGIMKCKRGGTNQSRQEAS